MKPYIPDNRSSLRGMAIVALTAVLGGLAIGGLLFLLSKVFYVILLFPILIGFLAGVILERAVKAGKVRIPMFVIVCALLMGAVAYISYNFYDYYQVRQKMLSQVSIPRGSLGSGMRGSDMAEQMIDEELVALTGQPGFLGYMLLQIREGMSVKSARSSSSYKFTPFFTLLIWIIEMASIGIVAAFFAKRQTKWPFCQTHDCWYGPSAHLGGFRFDGSNLSVNQMREGEFEQVGPLLEENAPVPSTEIFAATCPKCANNFDSHPWIEVSHAFLYRGKLEHKHVMQGLISQAQFLTLSRGKQA